MIYWSLQQTAKFNNKACLLHLIAAASNIYLEQQEGSRESQYKVHIIGFFPQQCAHTLKVFCFFPVCLILISIIRFVTHYIKMSQEAAHDVCMLQYLILSILKQGNWASFILTLKNEKVISFFEFFFFNINLFFTCSHTTGVADEFVLHSLEYFNKICNSNQRRSFSWCWAVTQLLNSRGFLPV